MLEDLSIQVGKVFPKWFKYLFVLLLIVSAVFALFFYFNKPQNNNIAVVSDIDSSLSTEVINNDSNSEMYCEISGAVVSPNVYLIKNSGRVSDLVKNAKGFTKYADLNWIANNLNLSKKITDECKIYIPFVWDVSQKSIKIQEFVDYDKSNNTLPGSTSESSKQPDNNASNSNTTPNPPGLIDINKCDKETLMSLKGIGPAYAERIISNRPYANLDELQSKSKLSANLVSSIKGFIKF